MGTLDIADKDDEGLSSLLPLGVPRGVNVGVVEGAICGMEPLLFEGEFLVSEHSFVRGVIDPLGVKEIEGVPIGVFAPELGGWGVE